MELGAGGEGDMKVTGVKLSRASVSVSISIPMVSITMLS